MPDYCRDCGRLYDEQLGDGWEHTEWAQAAFKSHRHLMNCEIRERAYIRLDNTLPDSDNSVHDIISADDVITVGGLRRTALNDPLIDDVIKELIGEGKTGPAIRRALLVRGWLMSERNVYYRLKRCRIELNVQPAPHPALNDPRLDDLIGELVRQGKNGPSVLRILLDRGWSLSQSQVYYRLKRCRAELRAKQ